MGQGGHLLVRPADGRVSRAGGRACQVLIVEQDTLLAGIIGRLVRLAGGVPAVATQRGDAARLLHERQFDLLLVNVTQSDVAGHGLVPMARALQPDVLIAVTSGILGREEDLPPEGDLYVYMPFNLELLRGLVVMAQYRRGSRRRGA
jgi:DNA-binding response OmpR family regulator